MSAYAVGKLKANALRSITRITIQYDDTEDRIKLLGETPEGTAVLWFTQRLLNRVIAVLCQKLEPSDSDPRLEALNSFAQMAAIYTLEPLPPVQPPSDADTMLVQEVSITAGAEVVQLVLKQVPGEVGEFSLALRNDELRQWLAILHGQYVKAGWPTNIWPDWVEGRPPEREAIAPIRH